MILKEGIKELGLSLDDGQIDQFKLYYALLTEWNSFMNLTAITAYEEVCTKHFLDSLSLCKAIDCTQEYTVIDVGTGAGFPGIPLKIAFPDLKVTLLDSLGKRVKFLEEVIQRLDLKDIQAIHGRAVRPLAEKTMDRIARGMKKFVLDNPEPFIVQVNHGGERKPQDIWEPMPTITGKHGFGVVNPVLSPCIMCNNENNVGASVKSPLPTVTTGNRNFVVAPILIQYHSETTQKEVRGQGIKEPIMTVDGSNRYGLVASFLSKFYKSGTGQDVREPLHTVTCSPGHFGEVRACLIKYYGQGTGQDIKEPLDTVTAQDRFGLVTIRGVDYQIVDIGLRMLEPKELYGCQGFPDDYIIDRDYTWKTYPRSEQVKRCGNAVCPPIPAALVRANLPELCVAERKPNPRISEEQTGQFKFA